MLQLYSVHGTYEFSSLPMPPPINASKTGGRLSGQNVNQYMESFAYRFLNGRIRYKTDVRKIQKTLNGWLIEVTFVGPDGSVTMENILYQKLVLCTGVSLKAIGFDT